MQYLINENGQLIFGIFLHFYIILNTKFCLYIIIVSRHICTVLSILTSYICVFNLYTAAGLYYVAELIEEYSVKAKRVMYILLWVSECRQTAALHRIRIPYFNPSW